MEFFDSHAHLDDTRFNEDRETLIQEIKKAGITKFVSAGYSIEGSKKGLELSKKYEYIYIQLAVFLQMIFHKQRKHCGKI